MINSEWLDWELSELDEVVGTDDLRFLSGCVQTEILPVEQLWPYSWLVLNMDIMTMHLPHVPASLDTSS
jgi:hypothetical protein